MSDHDKKRLGIIERCKKLRAMTMERGASEQEALAAMVMLERLVAEYNIGVSELELRADAQHCITDGLVSLRSDQSDWRRLAISIERLYGTIAWLEEENSDLLGLGFNIKQIVLKFYGYPADVAGSIATLAICSTAIDTELAAAKIRGKRKQDSFELGMTDRLRERIKEMRLRRQGAALQPGALVVLKEKIVKEQFMEMGIELKRSREDRPAPDAGAYAAGRVAGSRVGIDQSVTAQARQIGNRS